MSVLRESWSRGPCTLLVLLGLSAAPASAEPSDGEWGVVLLEEALAPIERALHASGHEIITIRVSDEAGNTRATEDLSEAIGNFFWNLGYEVQVPDPKKDAEPQGALLELTVDVADFDQPGRAGSFLGLGDTSILRRAALGFHGRLEDSDTGRWYWQGAPYVQLEGWVSEHRLASLSEDRPAWAGTAPNPATSLASPWWEKALVGGLLAGVITLYFGGSN